MKKLYRIVLGILAVILLSGCGGESAPPASGTEAADGTPAETEAPAEEKSPAGTETSAGEGDSAETDSSAETEAVTVVFEGVDLEGNVVSQEVFTQSKLTMVNVWATYCNPCLNEMPGLGELAAEHDREEFQIIGVVSDVGEGEDQTLVEDLVRETGADYPHLLANESIGQALLAGVSSVPTTFFFDGEGAYLGGIVGSAEKSAWEELIHGLLEEM